MRHRTLTLLTAVALLTATGAAAQTAPPQFTFIVPVQLSNLVETVNTASIRCELGITLADASGNVLVNDVLGQGHTPIALVKACPTCAPADFSGIVTVTASVTNPGISPDGSKYGPQHVNNYSCGLELNEQPPSTAFAKTGTVVTLAVTGTP